MNRHPQRCTSIASGALRATGVATRLVIRIGAVLVVLMGQTALANPSLLINSINVNTTADEFGTGAACSLREAVQSANTNTDFGGCTRVLLTGTTDLINIPAGAYNLTRIGIDEDLNSTSDLDITASVTLDGAGPGEGTNGTSTAINGGAAYSGRLVHVLAATVILKDMTIERGHLPGGRFGGGLRTNAGTTTTLTNVVVGLNSADRGGGGILNAGVMTLNGSSVTNNQALDTIDEGGGGLFNADGGTMTLNNSRVLNNTAKGNNGLNTGGRGGGIYNTGVSLTLNNTEVDGNVADAPITAQARITQGGGIYSIGSLIITQSTISNNASRGNDAEGGGVFCGGSTQIDRSLITGNRAEVDIDLFADHPSGGGVHCAQLLTITDSIISLNTAEGVGGSAGLGGGLHMAGGTATIVNTTIRGNRAKGGSLPGFGEGGGISGASLVVINSTISGNEADANGGGIRTSFDVSLFNVTIAGNTSNADNLAGGAGGGIYITPDATGTVTMRNSVLADNVEAGAGNNDDCEGSIASGGNNVVQVINAGCSVTGGGPSDLLGIDAKLGAFAGNGGPVVGASVSPIVAGMGTHLPASDSPVIDHGDPSGCKGPSNVTLVTDQRGFVRAVDGPDLDNVVTCDTGAVEFGSALPVVNLVFADSFE